MSGLSIGVGVVSALLGGGSASCVKKGVEHADGVYPHVMQQSVRTKEGGRDE